MLEQELIPVIESVKQMPEVDSDKIISVLQERMPEVVQILVDQQVAEIRRDVAKDNDELIREINFLSAIASDVIEQRNYLLNFEKEIKQKHEEYR